jgi:hypothetical protein
MTQANQNPPSTPAPSAAARRHWARTAALLLLIVGGVLGVMLGVFVAWASNPYRPTASALAALASDATVSVAQQGDTWTFTPTSGQPRVGLVMYPGGRVDTRAYAPLAREIAARGYFVVLVPVTLNLALFQADAAAAVLATNPQIDVWAVGGHSLGGVAAAQYADATPSVRGLILWASASNNPMLRTDLAVLSISGGNDGLQTRADWDATRANLPADTLYTLIDGANHAQFGDYGAQDGDSAPIISDADALAQIVAASLVLLEQIAP